jgi:predicted O-methyltransferase YrrM
MDAAVSQVFELYDQRMAREAELWRNPTPGLSRDDVLLAVGPATGALLNSLVKDGRYRRIVEIGTSYGYSTLWLAEAARATGGKAISFDVAAKKQAYAAQMLAQAGLRDHVEFRCGDARELLPALEDGVEFVLLDCWKDVYVPCLELFHPKLAPGAVVVADNMIRPADAHADAIAYRRAVRAKPDMTSVLLSLGSGLEVSRKAGPLDADL